MDEPKSQNHAVIQTEGQGIQSGFKVTRIQRSVDSVEVLTSELRSLGSANLQFTLFSSLDGIAIGILISVGITLATVTFTENQIMTYVVFLVLLFVSGFAFIAFTVLAIIFYKKSLIQVNEILANEKIEIKPPVKFTSK